MLTKAKKRKFREALETALDGFSVFLEEMGAEDGQRFRERWLETFAARVKEQKGDWVYDGFMWHGFSFGIEPALTGLSAAEAYRNQRPAPFVVFDEWGCGFYRCEGSYPDLSALRKDVYVAHHNFKWTMVFTHEQPEIGPFFADEGA